MALTKEELAALQGALGAVNETFSELKTPTAVPVIRDKLTKALRKISDTLKITPSSSTEELAGQPETHNTDADEILPLLTNQDEGSTSTTSSLELSRSSSFSEDLDLLCSAIETSTNESTSAPVSPQEEEAQKIQKALEQFLVEHAEYILPLGRQKKLENETLYTLLRLCAESAEAFTKIKNKLETKTIYLASIIDQLSIAQIEKLLELARNNKDFLTAMDSAVADLIVARISEAQLSEYPTQGEPRALTRSKDELLSDASQLCKILRPNSEANSPIEGESTKNKLYRQLIDLAVQTPAHSKPIRALLSVDMENLPTAITDVPDLAKKLPLEVGESLHNYLRMHPDFAFAKEFPLEVGESLLNYLNAQGSTRQLRALFKADPQQAADRLLRLTQQIDILLAYDTQDYPELYQLGKALEKKYQAIIKNSYISGPDPFENFTPDQAYNFLTTVGCTFLPDLVEHRIKLFGKIDINKREDFLNTLLGPGLDSDSLDQRKIEPKLDQHQLAALLKAIKKNNYVLKSDIAAKLVRATVKATPAPSLPNKTLVDNLLDVLNNKKHLPSDSHSFFLGQLTDNKDALLIIARKDKSWFKQLMPYQLNRAFDKLSKDATWLNDNNHLDDVIALMRKIDYVPTMHQLQNLISADHKGKHLSFLCEPSRVEEASKQKDDPKDHIRKSKDRLAAFADFLKEKMEKATSIPAYDRYNKIYRQLSSNLPEEFGPVDLRKALLDTAAQPQPVAPTGFNDFLTSLINTYYQSYDVEKLSDFDETQYQVDLGRSFTPLFKLYLQSKAVPGPITEQNFMSKAGLDSLSPQQQTAFKRTFIIQQALAYPFALFTSAPGGEHENIQVGEKAILITLATANPKNTSSLHVDPHSGNNNEFTLRFTRQGRAIIDDDDKNKLLLYNAYFTYDFNSANPLSPFSKPQCFIQFDPESIQHLLSQGYSLFALRQIMDAIVKRLNSNPHIIVNIKRDTAKIALQSLSISTIPDQEKLDALISTFETIAGLPKKTRGLFSEDNNPPLYESISELFSNILSTHRREDLKKAVQAGSIEQLEKFLSILMNEAQIPQTHVNAWLDVYQIVLDQYIKQSNAHAPLKLALLDEKINRIRELTLLSESDFKKFTQTQRAQALSECRTLLPMIEFLNQEATLRTKEEKLAATKTLVEKLATLVEDLPQLIIEVDYILALAKIDKDSLHDTLVTVYSQKLIDNLQKLINAAELPSEYIRNQLDIPLKTLLRAISENKSLLDENKLEDTLQKNPNNIIVNIVRFLQTVGTLTNSAEKLRATEALIDKIVNASKSTDRITELQRQISFILENSDVKNHLNQGDLKKLDKKLDAVYFKKLIASLKNIINSEERGPIKPLESLALLKKESEAYPLNKLMDYELNRLKEDINLIPTIRGSSARSALQEKIENILNERKNRSENGDFIDFEPILLKEFLSSTNLKSADSTTLWRYTRASLAYITKIDLSTNYPGLSSKINSINNSLNELLNDSSLLSDIQTRCAILDLEIALLEKLQALDDSADKLTAIRAFFMAHRDFSSLCPETPQGHTAYFEEVRYFWEELLSESEKEALKDEQPFKTLIAIAPRRKLIHDLTNAGHQSGDGELDASDDPKVMRTLIQNYKDKLGYSDLKNIQGFPLLPSEDLQLQNLLDLLDAEGKNQDLVDEINVLFSLRDYSVLTEQMKASPDFDNIITRYLSVEYKKDEKDQLIERDKGDKNFDLLSKYLMLVDQFAGSEFSPREIAEVFIKLLTQQAEEYYKDANNLDAAKKKWIQERTSEESFDNNMHQLPRAGFSNNEDYNKKFRAASIDAPMRPIQHLLFNAAKDIPGAHALLESSKKTLKKWTAPEGEVFPIPDPIIPTPLASLMKTSTDLPPPQVITDVLPLPEQQESSSEKEEDQVAVYAALRGLPEHFEATMKPAVDAAKAMAKPVDDQKKLPSELISADGTSKIFAYRAVRAANPTTVSRQVPAVDQDFSDDENDFILFIPMDRQRPRSTHKK